MTEKITLRMNADSTFRPEPETACTELPPHGTLLRAGACAAGRVALRRLARELGVIAVAFVAGGIALFLLVPEGGLASNPAGLAWPVAAVAGALALLLVCLPLTRACSRAMRANPDAWGVAPRDEGDR